MLLLRIIGFFDWIRRFAKQPTMLETLHVIRLQVSTDFNTPLVIGYTLRFTGTSSFN